MSQQSSILRQQQYIDISQKKNVTIVLKKRNIWKADKVAFD